MAEVIRQAAENDPPRLLQFPVFSDDRGWLLPLEGGQFLPFEIARFFLIGGIPADASRANHTSTCQQVIVAIEGACTVQFDTGGVGGEHRLKRRSEGLLVPKGCFVRIVDCEPGTLLAVACDEKYVPR